MLLSLVLKVVAFRGLKLWWEVYVCKFIDLELVFFSIFISYFIRSELSLDENLI